MDFMVGLRTSIDSYDSIWAVVYLSQHKPIAYLCMTNKGLEGTSSNPLSFFKDFIGNDIIKSGN